MSSPTSEPSAGTTTDPTTPGTEPDPAVKGLDANNRDANNPYGWFEAGRSWSGDFGDPFVMVDHGRYLAFGSSTAGRYLPVMTSADLATWYAHDRWTTAQPPWEGGPSPLTDPAVPEEIRRSGLRSVPGDVWNLNDALVQPAQWALTEPDGRWLRKTVWAPSVARFGSTWNLYYAVRVSRQSDDRNGDGRFCISMATATSPTGPFRDRSAAPLVCDDDPAGSIDPEVFHDPVSKTDHLLWKAAGRVDSYPSSLKSIELDASGRPRPGARSVKLLETDESSWEGETIENPSMAHWKGRYLLVYSGNAWRADGAGMSRYTTGWADCPDGPRGPCTRRSSTPLLSSHGSRQGPGGGSLFVTPDGRLHLAYTTFDSSESRDPRPRRLRTAELEMASGGRLRVAPGS